MISLFESMAEVYIQLDGQDAWEMYANELIVSDLPDVWVNLASNGGKRNRQVI
jgi:ABC-type ATPase with predicted acetyltransferase domain